MAYEINIYVNEAVEAGNGVSKQDSEAQKNIENYQKQMTKYISAQTIQPFVQNMKTEVTTAIETLTGSRSLQERVNQAYEIAQFGINTYKNATAGATIAVGMGLSASAGVGIGLALTAIETSINSLFELYNYNIKRNQEDTTLQQSRTRMGVAYNRSRSY